MMWTHLFTPIALTRYGGQRKDLDPKYNSTCRAPLTLSDCLGRDVYDHLDYGVLPYLYDGLFSNSTNETILTRLRCGARASRTELRSARACGVVRRACLGNDERKRPRRRVERFDSRTRGGESRGSRNRKGV